MPVPVSYPGVYIQEVPSHGRTIAGVATSITAFVGRSLRGPVNEPVAITSYPEYQQSFGGLWNDGPMSFAVQQYFQNGGVQAIIVRVHKGGRLAKCAPHSHLAGSQPFAAKAASAGAWGNQLRLRIDHAVDAGIAAGIAATMFNLHIKDLATGATETHLSVSIDARHARFIGTVLKHASSLLAGSPVSLTARPSESGPAPVGVDPFAHASATALSGGSDGHVIDASVVSDQRLEVDKVGLYALEKADLFNMLCIPPFASDRDVCKDTWDAAIVYATRRRAVVLIDSPFASNPWTSAASVNSAAIAAVSAPSSNATLYFPRVRIVNPLRTDQPEAHAPSGAVAGVIARSDASGGVWKSPAGIDATLHGVLGLELTLTDREHGTMNQLGVNCLRTFPNTGPVLWGARTLAGANSLGSEWKYLPVRRTALFIEESLDRGTQWVVFEPNDEPLWAQIRLHVDAFMQNLFRQGAFQGSTPREAFFVKCGHDTTAPKDISSGIVNIVVGFAPLKPAEFVHIRLQQMPMHP